MKLNKNKRIILLNVIAFWSLKKRDISQLSDYELIKIALSKFTKNQVREILK